MKINFFFLFCSSNSLSFAKSTRRTMFTLAKLAYYACDEEGRNFYDHRLIAPKFNIHKCCIELIRIMKVNTYRKNGQYIDKNGIKSGRMKTIILKAIKHTFILNI